MSRAAVSRVYPDGSKLVRMRVPAEWDSAGLRDCPVCGKRVLSVYGLSDPSGAWSGWRYVCGRRCYEALVARGDA